MLGQSKDEARESALAALDRVQIADPDRVFHRYPHQLSGGMQQRVVIAMALASDPKLLVLDEPTTGLDATVEASVLDLVRTLRSETNAAVLLIAHNLGVIRSLCDRVGVMYAGKIVEEGNAVEVFERPQHPVHGRPAALAAAPRRPQEPARPRDDPRHPAPDRHATCRRASTSIAARSPTSCAGRSCRRSSSVGDGHWTRCHHCDRIGEIPEPRAGRGPGRVRRAPQVLVADERVEDVPPGRS